MAEARKEGASTSGKRLIRLTPAIGDWTTLKPTKLAEKRVKPSPFGFDRISQIELSKAHLIHYDLGYNFSKALKTTLDITSELFTIEACQTSYSDFIKRLFHPMLHTKISLPDLEGTIHFCLELSIVNTLINHAVGSKDLTSANRKLTELEEETIKTFMAEILWIFKDATSNAIKNPKFEILSSPDFSIDTTIMPTSAFSYFVIEIAIGDNPPAKILVAYQSKLLKTLLEKIETSSMFSPLDFSKLPEKVYDKISVPISINLGETFIPTEDLKKLSIGDVVYLDNQIKDPVLITLGEEVKFLGAPGISSGKKAVRILGYEGGKVSKIPEHEKVEKEAEEFNEEKALEEDLLQEEPLEKNKEAGYPIEEEISEEETLQALPEESIEEESPEEEIEEEFPEETEEEISEEELEEKP